jgi:large subunit ribosomal protein L15
MFTLHNLTPLVKTRKRVGRGGKRGGTSGKGHKGQKARTGGESKIRVGFEGGQMPLYRRLPKRGFNNARFQDESVMINLDALERSFNDGDTVTKELLIARRIIKASKSKGSFVLKILGNGELNKKLTIIADAFSASAKKAIEGIGGEARLIKES